MLADGLLPFDVIVGIGGPHRFCEPSHRFEIVVLYRPEEFFELGQTLRFIGHVKSGGTGAVLEPSRHVEEANRVIGCCVSQVFDLRRPSTKITRCCGKRGRIPEPSAIPPIPVGPAIANLIKL